MSPHHSGAGAAHGPAEPAGKDLDGCSVLIGVCGGIAAYKTCAVVSALAQRGAAVTVAMTESAARFVTPLTFESLAGRAVITSHWDSSLDRTARTDPQHIRLAGSLDAALVAPCTMSMLARLAHGLADDAVTLLLAAIDQQRVPVLLAPSMNQTMLRQPSTRRNLQQLAGDGYRIIDAASGWQACRTVGEGRLPEPADLLAALDHALRGRTVKPRTAGT